MRSMFRTTTPAPRVLAVVVAVIVALTSTACATLEVSKEKPASLKGVRDVSFLGAYDSRVMLGGVQTTRQVTTVGSTPVYNAGGYAGTVYYPQTSTVRTGEVAPNDVIRLVAEGFAGSVDGGKIDDLSATTPLEARSEMGMDWFARNNPNLPNHLVSVEVKTASVALDDARNNWTLGITALTLGILSPCLACTTAPCLAYPALATTKAKAEATATLRVYDRSTGKIVWRDALAVTTEVSADGFHNPEEVFQLLSEETGRRLGIRAAARLAGWLTGDAHPGDDGWSDDNDDNDDNAAPNPPPPPTPALDRPAGARPPPPPDPR